MASYSLSNVEAMDWMGEAVVQMKPSFGT